MIRTLKGILEYTVQAADGKIGKVKDLFFDDQVWRIRYFVIETGGFLNRQKVLISPHSVSVREGEEPVLHVDLTTDQIRSSPDIDADKPVSRQYEIEMATHYGWPTYWTMEPIGAVPVEMPVVNTPPEPGDPHLRSFREMRKYRVQAADGEVGELDDLLADDDDWRLDFAVVETGEWMNNRRLLIETGSVREVSFADQSVKIRGDREDLAMAPDYQPAV